MLNILICSLHSRARQLGELLEVLGPQCSAKDGVEYIVCCDGGEMTVGQKRNHLMSRVNREYMCFVDDDDMVSSTYVADILYAIKQGREKFLGGADCIGMCGYLLIGGKLGWQFRHSVTVSRWCKDKAKQIYFRYPNHLNPIKSSIAKCHPFPQINVGEDKSFSDSIRQNLRDEIFIEKPLYFYKQGNK